MKRSSDRIFENIADFLIFIDSQTPIESSSRHPDYDQLLSYLLTHFNTESALDLCPACVDLPSETRDRLAQSIATIRQALAIPVEIVDRNPGISPFAMQRLLEYFQRRDKPIEELLPVFPESEDAVEVYNKVFQRINTHVSPVFDRRSFALALLVVQWMRGFPLSRIILERIRYEKRKDRQFELASLIRGVMEDVEQIARFVAPKYLACYIDLLKLHLVAAERQDLVDGIPDVNVWLEFGASQQTQLSMMGLGLSRTSAIALSELIADDSLSENLVLDKLRLLNLDGLNLPNAIVREVKALLGYEERLVTE